MLNEIRDVTQYERGRHRRWFHDDFFDLYTWEDYDGQLLAFQLCYAKLGRERALRWSQAEGYKHEGVDAPESKPGRSMTALMVSDGHFDRDGISARFDAAAIEMPAKVRDFVHGKIVAYGQPA